MTEDAYIEAVRKRNPNLFPPDADAKIQISSKALLVLLRYTFKEGAHSVGNRHSARTPTEFEKIFGQEFKDFMNKGRR